MAESRLVYFTLILNLTGLIFGFQSIIAANMNAGLLVGCLELKLIHLLLSRLLARLSVKG
jgi:hypothetical protein